MTRTFHTLFLVTALCLLGAPAQADIVINEIMNDPTTVPDADGEWVEFYNTSMTAVDLTGWTLSTDGGSSFTFDGIIIHGRQYYVMGTNQWPDLNGGLQPELVLSSPLNLGNGAGSITLTDDSGTTVDMVAWDGGDAFPDTIGASLALEDPFSDNSDGANWFASERAWPHSLGDYGTPGQANHFPTDLRNWSFEEWDDDGPTHWQHPSYSYIEYEQESNIVYHGDSSVRVTLDAYQSGSFYTQTIVDPIMDGGFYDASLMVLDNVTNAQVALRLEVFDATGEQIADFVGDQSVNSSQWQEVSVGAFLYDEAVMMRLTIEFQPNFIFNPGTFYIDAASVHTSVTIAEIQADPGLYAGRRVKTGGIITQGTNSIHNDFTDGYLQRGQFGIQLYEPEPLATPLVRGDSVSVIGQVQEELQVTRLTRLFPEVASTDHPLPEPWLTPTGHVSGSSQQEGVWTQLRGELLDEPGDPGTMYTIGIDDGSGTADVVIHPDANLDLSAASIGDQLLVHGVLDVDQAAGVLQPSEMEDIHIAPGGVEFALTPTSGDIAPGGGVTSYDAFLANNSGMAFNNVTAWRSVLAPNGSIYGPLAVNNVSLPVGFSSTVTGLQQPVPGGAPAGTYVVYHNLGMTTAEPVLWASYSFEKTGAAADGAENWAAAFNAAPTELTGNGSSAAPSNSTSTSLPNEYGLEPVYPNPFNARTTIRYALPEQASVRAVVYDVTGREVTRLIAETMPAGYHAVSWDARSTASGVYFLQLEAGPFRATEKLVLIK